MVNLEALNNEVKNIKESVMYNKSKLTILERRMAKSALQDKEHNMILSNLDKKIGNGWSKDVTVKLSKLDQDIQEMKTRRKAKTLVLKDISITVGIITMTATLILSLIGRI